MPERTAYTIVRDAMHVAALTIYRDVRAAPVTLRIEVSPAVFDEIVASAPPSTPAGATITIPLGCCPLEVVRDPR